MPFFAELSEELPRALCPFPIDGRDREPDVDEHELTRPGLWLGVETHLSGDLPELHFREANAVSLVDAHDLTRNRQAHGGVRRATKGRTAFA